MKKIIKFLAFFLFTCSLFISCMEDKEFSKELINADKPAFSSISDPLVDKTAASVEVKASIGKENGAKITEKGFCYSTSPNPTVDGGNKIVVSGTGAGEYQVTIEGLSNNTTYYIRPYAINSKGIAYGDEISVTTNDGLGAVKTSLPSNIHATMAVAGGEILLPGEGVIISRGVYKSSYSDFRSKDTVYSSDNTVIFSCSLTNLDPSQKYYVQAFITNSYGTVTGSADSLITKDGLPIVTRAETSEPGYTNAIITSYVTNGGDETVEIAERGFCWDTISEPDITRDTILCGSGTGSFSAELTGLKAQTRYYVRSFAVSKVGSRVIGIVYGTESFFWTKTDVPIVRTEDIEPENISNGSALVKGTIENQGISPVTAAGICWSTTNTVPTVADNFIILPIDVGNSFSGLLNNLKGNTSYYFRAFAFNANTTPTEPSYGEVKQFTTPSIFTTLASLPASADFTANPIRESSSAYFTIGGNLYLLGGDKGTDYSDELWEYSIDFNRWQQLRSFDGGKSKWQSAINYGPSGAFVYGGRDFNGNSLANFYYYNRTSGDWVSFPDTIPVNQTLVLQFPSNNFLLLIGGKYTDNLGTDSVKNEVWKYKVDYGWEKDSIDFPEKQYGGIAVTINNLTAYVGMGKDAAGICNGKLWITEDAGVSWTLKTTCTIFTGSILGGVNIDNIIYCLDENYDILEYNTVTDVWRKKSRLPQAFRYFNCIYKINNLIHIGLGSNGSMMRYDPSWDN